MDLLSELNACYLFPSGSHLLKTPLKEVWANFIQNEEENIDHGIAAAQTAMDLFNRKLCGLLPNQKVADLRQNIEQSMCEMLDSAQRELQSMLRDSMSAELREDLKQKHEQFDSLKTQIREMPRFPMVDADIHGPMMYRKEILKSKDISSIDEANVINFVRQIEGTKGNEPMPYIEPNFAAPKHLKVAGLYSKLNWAGYFADDFMKVKEGRDRFNASTLDGMHAAWGSLCDILISNDKRFRKKAKACYAQLEIATNVLSVDEFNNRHEMNEL